MIFILFYQFLGATAPYQKSMIFSGNHFFLKQMFFSSPLVKVLLLLCVRPPSFFPSSFLPFPFLVLFFLLFPSLSPLFLSPFSPLTLWCLRRLISPYPAPITSYLRISLIFPLRPSRPFETMASGFRDQSGI